MATKAKTGQNSKSPSNYGAYNNTDAVGVDHDDGDDREALYILIIIILIVAFMLIIPLVIDVYFESRVALIRAEKALQRVEAK